MWNAGKVAYYEKDKIQLTQEQRGGLGYTPEMCMWMTTCYASKTRLPKNDGNLTRHTYNLYIPKSESLLIHSKILPRKVNQF